MTLLSALGSYWNKYGNQSVPISRLREKTKIFDQKTKLKLEKMKICKGKSEIRRAYLLCSEPQI